MIYAATGHRPERLGLSYSDKDKRLLFDFLLSEIRDFVHPYPTSIISGFAGGFDQAVAKVSLELGIHLIAAIPFRNFGSNYPYAARKEFESLLGKADEVVYVFEREWKSRNDNYLYIDRDKWMVDKSEKVLTLFDGVEKGGTFQTLKYAKSLHRPVYEINFTKWKRYISTNLVYHDTPG